MKHMSFKTQSQQLSIDILKIFYLNIVVLLIIDSWAKLKYPHPFFPHLVRNQESPSFLPYISVNTASAIILTLGSCRAYLFGLFPAQAVWLTVVVCPWDIVQSQFCTTSLPQVASPRTILTTSQFFEGFLHWIK